MGPTHFLNNIKNTHDFVTYILSCSLRAQGYFQSRRISMSICSSQREHATTQEFLSIVYTGIWNISPSFKFGPKRIYKWTRISILCVGHNSSMKP